MYKNTFRTCISASRLSRYGLIAVAVIAVSLFASVPDTAAQKLRSYSKKHPATMRRSNIRQKSIKGSPKKNPLLKTGPAATSILSPQPTSAPVSIVNLAEPDFLSGEASVTVNPKQPTVIRLGLAQNAVSIVEFPASDGIYYIHEGNPKLASVFQSPTKETDRSITIYPGETFIGSRDNGVSTPSAAITLQMRSGLVLILELVPVNDLRKNAHRCVINYNRDDVVAARRIAGLAYDLGEDAKTVVSRGTKASSKLVGPIFSAGGDESPGPVLVSEKPLARAASIEMSKNAGREKESGKSSEKPKTELEISTLANKKLAECLKNPRKQMGSWSKSGSGLVLSVSRIAEIDSEQRLVVVAVRNETAGNLRLVPGSPELQVQTADTQGNPVQSERLERLYVESTSLEGMILPGSTVYYALVYKAPIIGINQRVRVLVSHREAADSPVAASLSAVDQGKE